MKNPKHPVTKKELVGGFNPLTVSGRPFGFRGTEWFDEVTNTTELDTYAPTA